MKVKWTYIQVVPHVENHGITKIDIRKKILHMVNLFSIYCLKENSDNEYNSSAQATWKRRNNLNPLDIPLKIIEILTQTNK